MSITNTRLAYLYRDADNYKVRHEVVFAGQMSEDEKMRIIASLEAGEYFFPGPLGLNDERFGSETEADHPFFEFCYFEETPDKPTTDISIAEIVKRFENNAHLWKDYEDSTGDVELKEDGDVGLAASEAKDDLSPRAKALLFETLELFRKADPRASGYAYYWSKIDHDGVQPIVFGDRAQAQSYLDAMRHNEPRNRRWDQCRVEGPFMDL